ncbi:WD repeat-containing protein 81 isoform X2 [Dendroctonus ponderosae]|uniref:WD repeat-containing protein 81 isoform X2 n=1 Tax=Dendroctonus ponderosae TaxID=77166 RepID=UPI0020351E3E|nr:WD repeat-containing protein 81 isoform X2 [Dendroctonus ponderosae]
MELVFEELGIPPKYLKKTVNESRFIALVHKQWLKSLFKSFHLRDFIEKSKLESWNTTEEPGSPWVKIFVSVYKKKNLKVIPLPRIRPNATGEDNPLLFAQLMQYISQTNFKNLWKNAFKKYGESTEATKETQVTLIDYNDALREIILRMYGCLIVNTLDPSLIMNSSRDFDVHLNVLPTFCGVETLNAVFLLHIPYLEHNLSNCVTFSPAILDKCYTKPLFIIYQLIQLLKSLHDRSLTLGDITLHDIYLTEDLWLYVFPKISSNIYVQNLPKTEVKHSTVRDCWKLGHKFDSNILKCEFCGLRTYDKVQVCNESLEELCKLWIDRKISNFTYISALNKYSGRKLGDPNCHYVFPWVTNFASRCGKNWRDLKKSKYRLNKGDRQLDLTYDHSQTQVKVPHHVSDVLSAITYYVYMARRTPKSVLCKNVRTIWVPAEYPSSIQRMQEWTPDECIPEFFTDPSIFRSTHEDLDDLEVPAWATGPEDFIERHREALESNHVSERLHYWIDLTFGYKLSGRAAIKTKNVCLHLADDHTYLTKSGIVQLFYHPHPPRAVPAPYWGKTPPKVQTSSATNQRSRDRSNPTSNIAEAIKSDEDDNLDCGVGSSNWSPLGLSKMLSRSRSSLHEEQVVKPNRSPSATRSASVGPKNPTFTSHVANKSKSSQVSVHGGTSSLNTGLICLPKDYKPDGALESLEKKHSFISKTFHTECAKTYKINNDTELLVEKAGTDCLVQNAFTNFIYSETFDERYRVKTRATKSYTFPMDNFNLEYKHSKDSISRNSLEVPCNYSEIISARRVKELQVLGCLIVEIFLSKQIRALGSSSSPQPFSDRLKSCLTIAQSCQSDIPACVSYIINLLLRPEIKDQTQFSYPSVTNFGLPPPSAHLLLEPLLHCVVPFPKTFFSLYKILESLKEFRNVALELNVLYHFDCDGTMCAEYENLERTKILLAQNIAECKVKTCTKQLEALLETVNTNTDAETINILVPHIRELIEDPPTAVLAAWYLFDPIARILGPKRSAELMLESVLKLYENEPSESYMPYNGKIAKIYHHSFLLRLIVRLGLKCFLDHFVTPLVEAVGGYKDYDRFDSTLHTHSEKVLRKTSHLKYMDAESHEISISDESSPSSSDRAAIKVRPAEPFKQNKEEEMFELDEDKESENQMKSLIEHLELNIATDLPFNVSNAEEALDATLIENIHQLQSLEELNLNLTEESEDGGSNVTSPTIPIPASRHNVMNISCEIGSRKSESDSLLDKKAFASHADLYLDSPNASSDQLRHASAGSLSASGSKHKRTDTKISDMSSDSIIWLSHRLGPVLMSRYLSRNLLKMLTLCYVGRENLLFTGITEEADTKNRSSNLSVTSSKVVGDDSAFNVLECLASIAALYGEKLILFQYFPHMSELVALCKRKLTQTLEGGLISCLALLKHIIPYLSDATLMDQLQDILSGIFYPTVRLLGSTKYLYPNGYIARSVLARKYIDTLYVLSIRIGSDMTRKYLAVPALQRFFYIFDKVAAATNEKTTFETESSPKTSAEAQSISRSSIEFTIGGRPISAPHLRLKDSESLDSLSSTQGACIEDNMQYLATEEIREVFNAELAYVTYIPFLKHMGVNSLDITLKNHEHIRELCQEWEQEIARSKQIEDKMSAADLADLKTGPTSNSVASNISVIGNRIDIQTETSNSQATTDLLSLVSNRMENSTRHLKGNWFSYWAHETGRPEKDTSFHFNQIKLQTFVGHSNSVKSLYILDNENSFMSGSRDKTVKLWSLRSQGDGTSTSSCQWTYAAHKKSILSLTFIESMRLVASCDSVVHLWDPFMGAVVGQLESPKFSPVNVVKSMPSPSSLIFSATTEGTIKVIDGRLANYVYDLKITVNPSGLIRCLAIGPSGSWVAAGQSSGSITVLDTRTGLVISSWRAHEGEVLQIVAVTDEILVSSSLDQNISVWSVSDGRFKHHMSTVCVPRGATEPAHCLCAYEQTELISATTANRVGVHTEISFDSSYSSTKLRGDTFKGLLTAMAVLPLNRLLLLGADNGQISLLC